MCGIAGEVRTTGTWADAGAVAAMWRDVRRAAGDLDVAAVTAAALCDRPPYDGLTTADRRLKDSGEAFLAG